VSTDKALEVWAAQSVCDLGILLSAVSFALHVARPCFERVLRLLTLRVAADLWWLAYLVLRGGCLFLAALAGLVHLNLDLMADIKVGLPFVPLGTVALVAALGVKVFRDSDGADHRASAASAALVMAGALLNLLGYVLVMEAPGDEYAATPLSALRGLARWRSNANWALASATFTVAAALLVVLAIGFHVASTRQGDSSMSGDERVPD
jgi:hypothetical protein